MVGSIKIRSSLTVLMRQIHQNPGLPALQKENCLVYPLEAGIQDGLRPSSLLVSTLKNALE